MEVKPGYKQTEAGVIPEKWDAPHLRDLFTFKNGLNKAKEFFGYGTPIVNYMDVYGNRGVFVGDLRGRVSLSKQELKAFDVRKGDVFFTRTSETAEEVGMTSVMLDEPKGTVFSGFVLRGRPKDESLNDQFKKYCFSTQSVRKQITSQSTETTRALTNGRYLGAVAIARPDKREQSAIAEALSDADALLGGLDRLIAKKRDLKQAAMQQLLTGQTRLPGFHGEWEVKRLGTISELKNGYAFKSSTYTDSGEFRIITIANVQDGYMDNTECNRVAFIPSDVQTHHKLRRGDILISMTGNVGRACRVNEDNCLLNQRVGKLVSTGIEDGLLFFLLRQCPFIVAMMGKAKGGAQGNLSVTDITEYQFNVPSDSSEQTAIAEVLTDMDAELTGLEQRREKTRALKQAIMQELLTGKTRLV